MVRYRRSALSLCHGLSLPRESIAHATSFHEWQVLTIVGAILILLEVLNGLGRHEYYLTPTQRRHFQKFSWVDWMQTFLTLMLTKISICLFLLRIMVERWLRRPVYALIGILIVFHMTCVFLFLGVCRPLRSYWELGVDGVCLGKGQVERLIIAQGGK